MSSYFKLRHSRSMNTLSIQRPRPSIEMRMPAVASMPVKSPLGELAALVGVEDLRLAKPGERLLQRCQAEPNLHRVRQPPRQHRPTRPVDDRHQVEKPSPDRDVGDIGCPDMVRPCDHQVAQEIRKDLV